MHSIKILSAATLATLISSASLLNAVILFEESFDYGASDIADIRNLSNYSGNTGTIDYIAGVNLTGLGGETGGHLFYDFASAGSRSVTNTNATMDPFPTASAGDTFWIAGIIQYNTLGEVLVQFQNSQSVNNWGFGFDAAGNVVLSVSDNGDPALNFGSTNPPVDTGADALADGSSYVFLSRATLGSGTSPDNSVVDFWFNPSNLSSVTGLGAPTFSTGTDSKIGRDSGAYTGLFFGLGGSPNVRVDEVRFGTDFASVAPIPEPSSYVAIAGLLGLGLAFWRRRRG